ncbi:MAG: cell division protein FtsX [Acidimicrobiales bacterium]
MGGKFGYAFRETLQNLRRNLLLTTASVVTAAVSLSLVGSAMLLRYGVANATARWKGGIEFEVFLSVDSSPEQRERIGRELEGTPDVADVQFVSQGEQFELAKVLFADRPEFLENVDASVLPPSYRVKPRIADAEVIKAVGQRFQGEPGVREVVFAFETVRTLLKVSSITQSVIFGIAALLLFAACLLILNTIRMAIFARRREIEVMKLVGATNWFIRGPFMIEGLLQGLVGAATAFGVVALVRGTMLDRLRDAENIFSSVVVLQSQVITTGVFLVVLGAAIGAVGAGVAITRFLDV